MNSKYFILFLFFWLASYTVNAQLYTAKQLVQAWKVDDVTQTIKAEETYADLKTNVDLYKSNKLISELEEYLKVNYSKRLDVRIFMYKTLATIENEQSFSIQDSIEFKEKILLTLSLEDQQLLSEVYSLYMEVGKNSGDRLFYSMKVLEEQQKIGFQYFPLAYMRFYNVTFSLYRMQDYEQCIKYAKASLGMMKTPKTNLLHYCYQAELIGLSYYELGNADSTLFYFQNQ